MVITHKFEMHLDWRAGTQTIYAVQGDANTRAVELDLICDNQPWTIPEGVTVKVRYPGGEYDTMPDGSRAWSVSGSAVTALISPELTKEAGETQFQVVLYLEDATLSTFTILLDVQAKPMDAVDSKISMVRGTTHTVNITLTDEEGNARELEDGEVLRFGVKLTAEADCLIEKELTNAHYDNGVYVLILNPADTESLPIGSYIYDVGLQSGASYFNVIRCSRFELLTNVTSREVEA